MNQITQLTSNIAGLHKILLRITGVEDKPWKSQEVRDAAILVRNTFDEFEQKWRDGMGSNKFFVFCLPRYAVLDGPPVWLANEFESDEINQLKFKEGCEDLRNKVLDRLKKMQDARASLLSLHRQSLLLPVFDSFDDLNKALFDLIEPQKLVESNHDKLLQEWDHRLISLLKENNLHNRFHAVFADTSKPIAERIQTRKESIISMVDTLANSYDQASQQGPILMTQNNNFGDNTNIGGIVNGSQNQTNISQNILRNEHEQLLTNLEAIKDQLKFEALSEIDKERAEDAVVTVIAELEKSKIDQRGWKIVDSIEKVAKIADASVKLQPLVASAIKYICEHFPQ